MDPKLSRRSLLLGSAALLVSGCVSRAHRDDDDESGVLPPLRPALPATRQTNGLWYSVVVGDSVLSISRRSGVRVEDIVAANRCTDRGIVAGDRLWLPGAVSVAPVATREAVAPVDELTAPRIGNGYVLVPRSAWTSNAIAGNNRPMNGVNRITVHHTGEHEGMAGLADVEVIRRIEKYHVNERHWAAIGYHYLVGRDGRIYEGRPVKFQGAHVLSENENNVGISVIGDFNHQLPNAQQLTALAAFLGDTRARYRVQSTRLYGHRDLNKSICPGDALYAWLQKYKRA